MSTLERVAPPSYGQPRRSLREQLRSSPIEVAAPAPPPPRSPASSVPQQAPAAPHAARRRSHPVALGAICGFAAFLSIGIALAPHATQIAVSPSTVPASVCGVFGPPTSVTKIDSAGPSPLYGLICGDGVRMEWAN